MSSTINVLDFGAKNDGKTDSSSAFQKAINSLPNGGVINVPKGIYIIKNVVVKSNISLIGEGTNSILKLPANGKVWDMVLITGGNVRAENVVISDLVIDGSADTIKLKDVQMHGLDVEGGTKNLTISRVNFQNTCGDGIRTTQDGSLQIVPQYIDIDSCTFKTTGRQDIAIVHAYDFNIHNCTGTGSLDIEPERPLVKRVNVSDCIFDRLDAASKNDAELAEIVVRNSKFQESLLWSLRGMLVDTCEIAHMRVSTARDVTIQNNTMRMLELFPSSGTICSNITVSGNNINNSTVSGDLSISGISGQTGTGLYMWNAQDCMISGNTIRGEVYGVYVSSGCNRTIINNNSIEWVQGRLPSQYGLSVINNSDSLAITGNTFLGWIRGILTDGASAQTNMVIENNKFNLSSEQCIYLRASINTSIKLNFFNNNGAVYIYKGTAIITDNDFNNVSRFRIKLEGCKATVGNNKATVFNQNIYQIIQSQVIYI